MPYYLKKETYNMVFECKQCGRCCTSPIVSSMQATVEDIARWRKEGRTDILKYVWAYNLKDADWCSCDIWVSPITGEDMIRCPFLRKVRNKDFYECRIHDTKPEECREYPTERHDFICLRMEIEEGKKPTKKKLKDIFSILSRVIISGNSGYLRAKKTKAVIIDII